MQDMYYRVQPEPVRQRERRERRIQQIKNRVFVAIMGAGIIAQVIAIALATRDHGRYELGGEALVLPIAAGIQWIVAKAIDHHYNGRAD